MENWFKLKERNTSVSQEIIAGITTFLTMVYIVVVNPAVLSNAGMEFNGVFIATIAASMTACLIMGIFANMPIVLAPGMGLNAFFAFAVVIGMSVAWPKALGAVFVASIIFLVLSLTNLRYALIDSIPRNLKLGISTGIGLFVSFIGLQSAKLIVDSKATLVTMGNMTDPMVLLTIFNLLFTVVMMIRKVKGAIFIGMLVTAVLAWLAGFINIPQQWLVMPSGISATAMQLDIGAVFSDGLYAVVFTFLLITLFDTTGTMLGVAEQAGLMRDGQFPKVKSALLADAIGSTVGAMLGTSPTSAYVESGAGVAAGGRTGLMAVVVAALLGVSMFFAPVAQMLSSITAVTAPPLIIVGFLMMMEIKKIEWDNFAEAFPAFLIMFIMPLGYSIATGIGVGFIAYTIINVCIGKAKTIHPLMYIFTVLFIIQLGFLSH